jgi:hypothetical protein
LIESDRIETAIISNGTLDLTITNATNLSGNLSVTIPDLETSGGQPLVINRNISGQQGDFVSVNLSGYRIVPTDMSLPQSLGADIAVTTVATTPQQVAVSENDSFLVDLQLSGLQFSSVTGIFVSQAIDIDTVNQDIDVPTGFDSVEFTSAVLMLEVENAANIAGSLQVEIRGDNGKVLTMNGLIAPSGQPGPMITTLVDSNAADFLSPLPSRIDAFGTVTIGDGVSTGTVTSTDYIFPNIRVYAPLEIKVGQTSIDTDVQKEKIDQEDIEIITDHVVEGRFFYNIVNHLPLGAYINIRFGADSVGVFNSPLKTFDSLFVTAAPTNAGGIVSDTVSTGYQEIFLDSADVRNLLERDTLFSALELVLEGTGGQTVKFIDADFITITGRVEVIYQFDGKF